MKPIERRDGIVHTYVRSLPHPPSEVFRALTEGASLEAWFPARIVGEPGPGARVEPVSPPDPAATFPLPPTETARVGEVLVFEPPHRFELTFGDETLRFSVTAAPWGSVLVLVTEPREEPRRTKVPSEAPANDTSPKASVRAA